MNRIFQDVQDGPSSTLLRPSWIILVILSAGLFLLLNLFFLFDGMACPFFLPRFVNLLGHRFTGEMSRPSVADDHELFGGVESLLDAEIFPLARNPRLSFIINQALSPGVEI